MLAIFNVRDAETGVMPSVIFIPLAAFFIILGVLFYHILPAMTYEKYQKLAEKTGVLDSFFLSATAIVQQKKIDELQSRIDALEKKPYTDT